MRKSSLEKLKDAKRKAMPVVQMNSLDDLAKLLVDGDRAPEERIVLPTQKSFMYAPDRINAYMGVVGCAKTTSGNAKVMLRMLLEPGSKALVGRHDYNDLMDTTKRNLERMLERLPPNTRIDRDKNPPEKWYIQPAALKDGAEVYDEPTEITFMGLKESLGSYEFNIAFVDEANEVEKERIHEIDTRLRNMPRFSKGKYNYSLNLCFNPPDETHWLYTACTGLDHTGKKVEAPWMRLFTPVPNENVRNLPEGYYARLASSLPEDMRKRLIEGQWGASFPGDPVYRQFRRSIHGKQNLKFHREGTLFRFWDFGYSRPAVLWVQIDYAGHYYFLRELLGHQQEVTAFAAQVNKITAEHFPGAERIVDIGDPAVKQRKDTGSTLDHLFKAGVQIRYKHTPFDLSLQKGRLLFETLIEAEPAIQIDERRCPILVRAMQGGYHLDEDGIDPVKDGYYDHLADCFRYGIFYTSGVNVGTATQLPASVAYDPEKDR